MKDMVTGNMCDGSRTGRDETWVANRTIQHRRAESKILFLLFSRNKRVLLPLHLSANVISTTVTLYLEASLFYFLPDVEQSTGMIRPHNIFQPFLKKRFHYSVP